MMNDAEKCRRNGWAPGTILEGREGNQITRIELTAVGRENVLAVAISENGEPKFGTCENLWALDMRRWRKIRQEARG